MLLREGHRGRQQAPAGPVTAVSTAALGTPALGAVSSQCTGCHDNRLSRLITQAAHAGLRVGIQTPGVLPDGRTAPPVFSLFQWLEGR